MSAAKSTVRTTIRDVAAAAGVSTATVSRVLNSAETVDPALAERVRTAVRDMGYRPSGVARNLRRARTMVLCLIISDIRNPFFTDVVRGIEDYGSAAGYSLVLCNADEDLAKESAYLDLAVSERMAGVVISPSSTETRLVPLLEHGIPAVTIDRRVSDPVDAVVVDSTPASQAAVTHLFESGYERVACITGPEHATTATDRLAGWRLAHEGAGRAVDERLARHADYREEGGLRVARELLSMPDPPDALFVANNVMTVGALTALEEAGRTIPETGLACFDDPSWARLMHPSLTAIAQPTYDLGRQAAELLAARIDGSDDPPRELRLTPTLHVRDSSRRVAT